MAFQQKYYLIWQLFFYAKKPGTDFTELLLPLMRLCLVYPWRLIYTFSDNIFHKQMNLKALEITWLSSFNSSTTSLVLPCELVYE